MKSLNNFIKQKADMIWNHWEEVTDDDFIDTANKVGSFADWFDEQSDDDLAEVTGLYYAGDMFFTLLRKEVNKGIAAWFDGNRHNYFI